MKDRSRFIELSPCEMGLLLQAKRHSFQSVNSEGRTPYLQWCDWVEDVFDITIQYAEKLIRWANKYAQDPLLRDSRSSVFKEMYFSPRKEKIARKMARKGVTDVTVTKIASVKGKETKVKDHVK